MPPRKDKQQAEEGAFRDVSAETEKVEEANREGVAVDPESGEAQANPEADAAAAVIADEQSRRAAGSGEGGGPWPPELLAKLGTTARQALPPAPVYTSHEVSDK